ncbi:amino acid-binding protein [Pantoea vagans]|uniref:amino acid-binding protein n=1 Tax=Pantoea vagans TaxID=470934 RepID=UPI0022525E5C|nr:amino acid-binding protein [Pantoea vagans]MCX3307780.1 amino acid-binding protein [Pantoea vagans]
MFDIHVILQNSPGTLSRLTTLLGRHGIGLEGGGLFSSGAQSHAHFLVAEGERARAVLEAEGIAVEALNIPLIRRLPQQRPGELGAITARLADAGINILVQYSDHANQLILITDNNQSAAGLTREWAP